MRKKEKRNTIVVVISLVLILSLSFLLLPINTTKAFVSDEYKYGADFSIELEDVPVYAQQTAYTCYAVSMVIVKNYLGADTDEQTLLAESGQQERNTGMLPQEYLSFAAQALERLPYTIVLHNPKSETEILNMVTSSLKEGLPVIFFYAALDDWNRPNYNTHYGVIYGIDMGSEIVKLSNPYGYLEELPFVDFFAGLAFKNYAAEPFIYRIGRIINYIKSNNLFLLEGTL